MVHGKQPLPVPGGTDALPLYRGGGVVNEDAAADQLDYLVNILRRVEAEMHASQRSAQLRLERARRAGARARQRGESWAFYEARRLLQGALSDLAIYQMRSRRKEAAAWEDDPFWPS